jgi:hypothetical protein
MILNSPTISGSLTVTGNIIASGSITLSGSVASASYAASASNAFAAQTASYVLTAQTASFVANAQTASFVALAQSASNAVSAATASFANAFTVAGTLTAQTLVVQTITSSVSFITGSTKFGSIIDNTHQFTGSLYITGSVGINAASSFRFNGVGDTSHAVGYDSTVDGAFLRGQNGVRFITGAGGGTERMRITSTETTFNYNPQSGSLLSGYNYLNFGGGSIMYRNTTDLYIGSNAKYGSAGTLIANYTSANGMGLLTMDGGALNWQATTGSVTANTAYGVPIRFTITSAGNVGIGTTTPVTLLGISKTLSENTTYLTLDNKTNSKYNWGIDWAVLDSTNIPVAAIRAIYPVDNDISLAFYTYNGSGNVTERMRITSDGNQINYGNIFLNQTSVATVNANATSIGINGIYYMNRGSGSGLSHVILGNGGNVIGGISSNTTNAQFNTSSDYRLKKDLKDFNALNILSNIKLYDFAWKLNDLRMYGVIAHELKEILPYAVVGEKDELDENNNIKSQGVDYSLLTPVLAKAIQELKAQNDDLQSQINELKAQ